MQYTVHNSLGIQYSVHNNSRYPMGLNQDYKKYKQSLPFLTTSVLQADKPARGGGEDRCYEEYSGDLGRLQSGQPPPFTRSSSITNVKNIKLQGVYSGRCPGPVAAAAGGRGEPHHHRNQQHGSSLAVHQ